MSCLIRRLDEFNNEYLETVAEFKKRFLCKALLARNGDVGRTSLALGIPRRRLEDALAELKITRCQFTPRKKPAVSTREQWRRVEQGA